MKAAVLTEPHNLQVMDIELPDLMKDEALIQVKASGVCGSDLPRVLGNASHYYPNVFGHEFSGIVTKVRKTTRGLKSVIKLRLHP